MLWLCGRQCGRLRGRTVFEALYERASLYKQRAELRRISHGEEVMNTCTFSPAINPRLTRWENLAALGRDEAAAPR